MKFPSTAGRIVFEGLPSGKFWIRAFGLEKHIEFVQAKVNEKPQRKMASVPIVNEHIVDEEHLRFYYVMHLKVDALGIQDAIGMVFYSDRENAEKVLERRDKLADELLATIEKRSHDEGIELEGFIAEPGKET